MLAIAAMLPMLDGFVGIMILRALLLMMMPMMFAR